MKFTTLSAALVVGAGAAYAQLTQPNIGGPAAGVLGQLSTQCQAALVTVATNPQVSTCLPLQQLIPVIATNGSIIPPLDNWLSTFCRTGACSNATLSYISNTVYTGCSNEFAQYNVTNSTLQSVVSQYPLAREIVCLKTTAPVAANFTNASIPINATAYNNTNGTFCATSLLTQLSAYWGTNLTVPYLTNLAMNSTALNTVKRIPPTALCQDCIIAAVDLVEQKYPFLGQRPVGRNATINSFLNNTCSATGLVPNSNGTLPATIRKTAWNGTQPTNSTSTGRRAIIARDGARL